MKLPELNALAKELRENDAVQSATTRGYGSGNYRTATAVALEVTADYAPTELTDAINHDGATLGSMRSNINGQLEATVFIRK